MLAQYSGQSSSISARPFDASAAYLAERICPGEQVEIAPAVLVETERVPRSFPVPLITAPACVSRCVSTPRMTSFCSMLVCSIVVGTSPTPLAGQDTHGAEQGSYKVTDAGPGNARGTSELDRQVNAKATEPVIARVRSARRSKPILD